MVIVGFWGFSEQSVRLFGVPGSVRVVFRVLPAEPHVAVLSLTRTARRLNLGSLSTDATFSPSGS